MAPGWVPMLCGLALTSVAGGVSVGSDPAPGGWTLDIVNAGGDVVLVANAITVTTSDGAVAAVTSAVNGGPAGDVWRLFTERSELDVLVLVEPDDAGTTAVSITPIGTAAGDVSEVSISFDARAGERFFGLGERADAVEHRGSSVVNRVSDGPWTVDQLDVVRQVLPAAGFSDRRRRHLLPDAVGALDERLRRARRQPRDEPVRPGDRGRSGTVDDQRVRTEPPPPRLHRRDSRGHARRDDGGRRPATGTRRAVAVRAVVAGHRRRGRRAGDAPHGWRADVGRPDLHPLPAVRRPPRPRGRRAGPGRSAARCRARRHDVRQPDGLRVLPRRVHAGLADGRVHAR